MSWLEFALNPFPDLFAAPPGGVSVKVKDALLKQAAHRSPDRRRVRLPHQRRPRRHGRDAGAGDLRRRINRVAPDATASAQRDAILDIACNTGWLDPRDEAKNLAWVRAFYRDLFADSGGVPVPGDAYDGRVHQPSRRRPRGSGAEHLRRAVAHALLSGTNYPRLQRVKARWDPRDVFRHALSIRAA